MKKKSITQQHLFGFEHDKGPYADHILIPQAQPEVVYFLYQMKAHIFLIANPKFQLQILCSFGDITKSVKLNGIPEIISYVFSW